MGFVSLQEDIEEALRLASLVADRLALGQMTPASADKIVDSVLKRCDYIKTTISEIKKLHSDLSRDTRNRIYTLRSERDDALKKVAELERALKNVSIARDMKKELAKSKIVIARPSNKHRRKKKSRTPRGNPFR